MNFSDIVYDLINNLSSLVIYTIVALIMVYFFWNTLRFIQTTDEKERKDRRLAMIYSIIAVAVAFSFWGLIAIIQQTFGIESGSNDIHSQVESLFRK
ncbi:MAG: hypothetical protein WAV11_01760 [Minisyncoccia bacterium]